ncbi:hypothetical protein CQ010_00135 [Arthrobacter sp. MYb211]|uniref:hypothetical protein n=1 Tax=Micrococcaceae TaxID=1268 RepID=UPI000BB78654|nr:MULTISPECIES: hypothetical protein [Micrococcaceae]PCC27650.1 hypothetical protein CIK76_15790 [Glutamicibacter sp. BW80]PRA13100.1 hypothetical protein CQ015_02390 [Arthrobacter sp. MYb221]PRC10293.1 hypothetical protein CQ010_00135 [Arthrobacter sp. MYb211]
MIKRVHSRQRLHNIPLKSSCILLALALIGCSSAPIDPPRESSPAPSESPAAPSLREFDLDNALWELSDGYGSEESTALQFKNGKANLNTAEYSIGDVVYSDMNGDGVEDALAPVEMLDGNSFSSLWFIWLAAIEQPEQLIHPVAASRSCGDFINEVTAIPGGIEITETRRTIFDEDRSCAEGGTWEETRTIAVEQFGEDKIWLPVQTGPERGYGGVCNEELPGDVVPFDEPYYLAPTTEAKEEFSSGEIRGISIAGLEDQGTEGGEPGGWRLYNVVENDDSVERCIWLPIH